MSKHVFISYAKGDRPWAEQVCSQLEESGIGCWMAPRDIAPGVTWPAAITEAIRNCRAMVVVFSAHANASPHMAREVEVADSRHVPILPVRVENIEPAGDMEYFLGNRQWFDLHENKIERRGGLPEAISSLLGDTEAQAPSVYEPPPSRAAARPRPKRGFRTWWLAAAGLVVVAAVVVPFALRPRQAPQPAANPPAAAQIPAPAVQAPPSDVPAPAVRKSPAPARRAPAPESSPSKTPAASSAVTTPPPAAPAASGESPFVGKWQAQVKYNWGASHNETFNFKVDGNEVYGTASYVGGGRGILDGKIEGNRISFTTKSQTILGDKTYEEKHYYKGRLSGDTIDFILQTDSGYDSRTPEMFTARRGEPPAAGPSR